MAEMSGEPSVREGYIPLRGFTTWFRIVAQAPR
jgi:hypothetical protein